MSHMSDLTPKQRHLLEFIIEEIRERRVPPTFSQMATAIGVSSKNSVAKLLRRLEEGGYIRRDSSARGIEVLNALGESLSSDTVSVPLVGDVVAGTPVLADENIEDNITLPADLVGGFQDTFLLRVRGESMRDAGILEDDRVLVRQGVQPSHGDIVVALLDDGETTVKRFMMKDGVAYLKAENPDYPDIYPDSEWTIQGKVVAVTRAYD